MSSSADHLRVEASIALAFIILIVATVWWKTPNLMVDVGGGRAVVHMELLGEYPADIRSIEISSEGREMPVWKIVAAGDMFQIHSVALQVGSNAGNLKPYWGRSIETAPGFGAAFQLDADHRYRVRICPPSTVGLCRSETFVLTTS